MLREPAQDALFVEDINDALRDAVRALGGTKEVGRQLRPDLTADAAGAWLKDCLNPTRRERLDPGQVLWLIREGRRIGCHSVLWFICDDAGYVRPPAIEPKDEAAELQRQAIAAVKLLERLGPKLERILALKVSD